MTDCKRCDEVKANLVRLNIGPKAVSDFPVGEGQRWCKACQQLHLTDLGGVSKDKGVLGELKDPEGA